MAQSIQSVSEQMLYSAGNASSDAANMLTPVPAGFSFFQPRVALGFSLLLLIVLARVFGAGKQKLPPGVKRLPRLPGMSTLATELDHSEPNANISLRSSIRRSFLGCPGARYRGSMALW